MSNLGKQTWTLAELADETGLSPRTIRYYISRGLVEGPAVAGRGAVYTAAHCERLRQIRELQAQGAMLAEIGRAVAGEPAVEVLPSPERWDRYAIAGDVVVLVRGEAAPWRNKMIRKALAEFAARISQERKDNDNDDGEH